MKYIINLFFAIFVVTMFLSCPYKPTEPTPQGVFYVHVLKENGEPFKDVDKDRFLVQYSGQYGNKQPELGLNEDDALLFECSTCTIYRENEEVQASDIINSLKNRNLWVAILDKNGEYKTVKKMYKDCYKKYNKNPTSRDSHTWCEYIYHCEIQLEKK